MNSDRINRYLTVGANIAILVGLIFVGLEVRNSSVAVSAQTSANINEGFNSLNMLLATDPSLARINFIGESEPNRLSDLEAIRFSNVIRSYTNQFIQINRLQQSGLLSEPEWKIYAREAAQMLSTEGGKLFVQGNAIGQDLLTKVQSYSGEATAYDDRLGPKAIGSQGPLLSQEILNQNRFRRGSARDSSKSSGGALPVLPVRFEPRLPRRSPADYSSYQSVEFRES